jgi:hypothetical protein
MAMAETSSVTNDTHRRANVRESSFLIYESADSIRDCSSRAAAQAKPEEEQQPPDYSDCLWMAGRTRCGLSMVGLLRL